MTTTFPPELWQRFQTAGDRLGLPMAALDEARVTTLYADLLTYNAQVNLTRITDPEGFLFRHVLDSLVIAPFVPEGATVADIGSGAGFPAIPLAMARPDVQVHAVESIGKKCKFIEQTAERFLLPLTVHNKRSEDLARDPNTREKMDVVTARAVAALPTLLEVTLPLLKVGGQLLAIKGRAYEEELQSAERALTTLKAEHVDTLTFEDEPGLENTALLIFEKLAPTPTAYPRPAGKPQKTPL